MSQIINSTTTESPEDVAAAGLFYGIDFETTVIKQGFADEAEVAAAQAEADAAKEKDPSKPGEGEKPAEVDATKADDKSKIDAEGKSADEQADLSEKAKKALKDKNKQIDKLTGRAKTAEGELIAERAKIAELERKLVAGNKEPAVVELPVPEPEAHKRPARPSRPKLEQFEYDPAKYDLAMDKYETETIPAYEDKLSEWTRAETVREIREAQAQEATERELQKESETWQQVVDSRDGLRDKLAAATDIKVSGAMDSVLRTMMTPEERATLLEHFVDNPDDAAEMMEATTSKRANPNRDDWEYNTALASRLLTKLESKISGKPAGPVLVENPVKEVPVKQSAPPAKPKTPVSAAPDPIEPVGARTSASEANFDGPVIDTSAFLAQREQQRIAKLRGQFGR